MALFERSFFAQLHGLRLLSRRLAQGRIFGEARGLRTGRSGEFADHRRYVAGDDLRSIDWPAYWRLRKPFVKLSESREERPVYVVLDSSASMGFGMPPRWDFGRRMAAALAFVALDSRERVTLLQLGDRPDVLLPALHGLSRVGDLCDRLETLPLSGRGSVFRSLALLPPFCPGRGLVLVLSDFFDPEPVGRALSALAATRHEVVLLHLVTPWETAPQLAGDWELEDAETGEIMPVSGSPAALAEYRQQFSRHVERMRSLAVGRGMRYILVSTSVSEASVVRNLLNLMKL